MIFATGHTQSAPAFQPLASRGVSAIEEEHPLTRATANAPIRVMHVITGASQGGAEKLLSDLIRRAPQNISTSVLTLTKDPPFFDMGANFSSLGLDRGQFSPLSLRRLRRSIVDFGPDILHAWLYHANFAAALATPAGTTQLWSIHNTNLPRKGSKPLTRLTAWLGGWLSAFIPAQTIYCSEASATWHTHRLGYATQNALVIENGVDFHAFRFDPVARAQQRAAWQLNHNDIAVGSIGRFSPQKDHATVAAALQQLHQPNLLWVLAGEGCSPENAELRMLRRGLRSIALGPRQDMPALLSALDLLVIGSAFGEALPIVGLEAVANGLPVVSTQLGDTAILVADPAYLARPADPTDLHRAIAAALPPLRGAAAIEGLRGHLRAQYDIDMTIKSYYQLYSEIFASRSTRTSGGQPAC